MRKITLPLVQPAVLAAWVLLFVMSMQEVSSSILLYSSHSIVLSVAVFDLWENGNPGVCRITGLPPRSSPAPSSSGSSSACVSAEDLQ